MLDAVREVTGLPLNVEIGPRRDGDPAALFASSKRAEAELGWVPDIPDIRGIVADAWAFHQHNR